ncbi:restriction endonuclease subunit S [Flavobacterium marginilacus]|uniref:restriction endonuclease subunit S n=1 Tax=Flavobacterium marginilacus TaxID=3003256 RepID=UPI00248E1AEF|nr:restriction endonuclease subunit S [Flavobacterium marginilacus]
MNNTITKLQTYSSYKPSGVEWLGDIPEHWELSRLGVLLNPISTNNRTDLSLLSITREKGVILRDLEDEGANHNFIPDDLSNYKVLLKGQFGMNKMKAWQGSYGISDYDGIVSPAYFIFDLDKKMTPEYFHLAIRSKLYVSFFGSASDGVRIGQWDLSKERMKQIPFLIPSLKEQTDIAQFLDDKTAKIDQAIAIKQQQIELLKERRQILIHKAVTQGINPDVKLKDSGVEWIGEIPEHWEVKRLKDICSINLNSLPENTNKNFEFKYVDIGSVSIEKGICNIEEYTFKNAPSRARRIAKTGDTIISTVRTYLKAIDFIDEIKSKYIYSTGFAVLQPKEFIYPEFLGNFVRSDAFTEQVTVNSKGMSYPAINSTDIGRLTVVHCGYEEQKQIIEYIETANTKISTAISLKEQEIEKLKEYKMSLIDGVVTGKVRVS